MQIKYYTTRPDFEPKKATVGSAGYDIQADLRGCIKAMDNNNLARSLEPKYEDCGKISLVIPPLFRVLIPTGLHAETPCGHFWDLRSRSGLPFKTGLVIPQGVGTIDQDYTGQLHLCFINLSSQPVTITDGERVGQVILRKMEFFDWLRSNEPIKPTVRGEGGFGSTGA
jgi:dUTP pyrophosphatase